MSFCFLALPPELRNLVYNELLHHDRRQQRQGYPAILRTCKQIHQEANDILYFHSTLTVDATFLNYSASDRELGQVVSGKDGQEPPRHPYGFVIDGDLKWRTESLSAIIMRQKWPKAICKASSVDVKITLELVPDLSRVTSAVDLTLPNHFLYSLVSRLNEGGRQQKVKLILAGEVDCLDPDLLILGFYPIAKLREHIQLELYGFPADLTQEIETIGQTISPLHYDILREAEEIVAALESFVLSSAWDGRDDNFVSMAKEMICIAQDALIDMRADYFDVRLETLFSRIVLLAKGCMVTATDSLLEQSACERRVQRLINDVREMVGMIME